jgi:hypothetical protein
VDNFVEKASDKGLQALKIKASNKLPLKKAILDFHMNQGLRCAMPFVAGGG